MDYYEILGVPKDATTEDVKRAYRNLVLQYHPDKNPNNPEAEQKFKEVVLAYETLSDEQRRQEYNNRGQGFRRGFSGFPDIFGDWNPFDFGYQSKADSRTPKQGAHLRVDILVNLEDVAVQDFATKLNIRRPVRCGQCSGCGVEPGFGYTNCSVCNGTGMRSYSPRSFIQIQQTCSVCRGQGKKPEKLCSLCHGSGQTTTTEIIDILVPAGILDGQAMVFSDLGCPSENGGPNGDLTVVVNIKPHSLFTRKGSDLLCKVSIDFIHAILGGEIQIPTLNGIAILNIPPGTSPGDKLTIKGQGVRETGKAKKRGDIKVEVEVLIPKQLSEEGRVLLEQYEKVQSSLDPKVERLNG